MEKIIFINDFIFGGGVEKVMYNVVDAICKEGSYDITVFAPYKEKNFYKVYPKSVKHRYFYTDRKKGNSIFRKASNRIQRYFHSALLFKNYDVAIAFKEGNSIKYVERLKAKKKIGWIHIDYEALHWTNYLFKDNEEERSIYAGFDKTVCVTESVRKNFIKTIGDPGNTIVRYNPIDAENIIKNGQNECLLKRPNGKTLFVTVGRLCREKGYLELIEALSKLNKDEYELWIIGSENDNYKAELIKKIENYNMLDTVKLLGHKENPYPYVKQADFFVCSSYTESFGLAIQEALILGVPVITTNCPGAVELLNDKISIVVDSMDEMRVKLTEIVACKKIADEYAKNVSLYYRCDGMDERMEDIIELLR